ncbi:MAG: hypothetical protein PVJ33_00565 [Lysobacterales bacterium]|jgi:hypothetical protein
MPMFEPAKESYDQAPVDTSLSRKRLGRPSELAAPSAHIVENDYINGEKIRCDAATRMPPW